MNTQHVVEHLPSLPDLAMVSPTHRYEVRLARLRHGEVVDDGLDYRDPGEAASANAVTLVRLDRTTHEQEEVVRCELDESPVACVQAMAWVLDVMTRWVKEDVHTAHCDGCGEPALS